MTAPAENTTTEPPRDRVRRPPRALFVLTALALLGVVLYAWADWTSPGDVDRHAVPPAPQPAAEAEPAQLPAAGTPVVSVEDRWREDVIGRWKTYHKGWRYMTVHPDGTATVEANLTDYAWHEKLLVGTDHVTFDVEWTIDDGHLHFETVGGEPEASVKVITTMHGDAKSFPIVHVKEEEFRYKSDKPDDPDFVWERIAPPSVEDRG